ncbi:TPA: hypothetical protein ACRR6O_001756 [Neisseria gonorrhoeae]
MKASQLTLAVLLAAAFGSAYAVEVKGGDSSKGQLIQAAESDFLPFGSGAADIKVSTGNGLSKSINLEAGPRSASATNTAMRLSTAAIRTPM